MPLANLVADHARPLTTAALCAAAGVTRGLLRLYEREGLLAAPQRTPAGYRLYPADAPTRLAVIRHLKEIGFTLKEIALLLAERDSGEIDHARLRELAQAQLGVIDERLQRLTIVRGFMVEVAAGNDTVLADPECRFLADFLAVGEKTRDLSPMPIIDPHRGHADTTTGAAR